MGKTISLSGRYLQILDEKSVTAIDEASLTILETTGVRFDHQETVGILRDAGAHVDGNLVRFPRSMVKEMIGECPRSFVLKARDSKYDIPLGTGGTTYTNGFGATQVFDFEKGAIRRAVLGDLIKFSRLADALSEVGYCLIEVTPQDVVTGSSDLYGAWSLLKYTKKNVHLSVEHADNLPQIAEMVELVGEEVPEDRKPFYSLGVTPSSPLVYTQDGCRKIAFAARSGVPLLVVSGGIAGATVPVTAAGAMALQNAEVLAGIVLAEVINPGVPCVYGSFTGPMNMRTAKLSLGSPELALMNAATAQLCRRYGIPFAYGTGGISDAWAPGTRAGIEKAVSVLTTTLAGVEVVHDGVSGLLGGANLASFEQVVIDNEMCKMINRICRGIEVDPERLALDVISEVGAGGNFLAHQHTVKHFREELWMSPLLGRVNQEPGKLQDEMLQLANEKVHEILDRPCQEAVSTEISRRMDTLLPEPPTL